MSNHDTLGNHDTLVTCVWVKKPPDLPIATHFPEALNMVSSRRQSTAGRKRRASEAPAARKRKPEEEAVVEEEPQEEAPREVKRRIAKEAEELKPVSHSSHGKVGDAE